MKTRFTVSVGTVLLIIAGVVAFAPPVRAQVAELFHIVFFSDRTQDSETTVQVEGLPLSYQVLQPGYLPDMFNQGASLATFGDPSEMIYSAGDQFLVLTQRAASAKKILPQGEALTVNGLPAVLQRGLAGHYDGPMTDQTGNSTTIYQLISGEMSGVVVVDRSSDVPGTINLTTTELPLNTVITSTDGALASPDMVQTQPISVPLKSPSFDYANAARLTFITGNTQVELLSNLPVEEVLKIAAGLSPAK
jgi:hypothetical protein